MRIAIILNGISSKKKFFLTEIYPKLTEQFQVSLLETAYAGHATALAKQATDEAFDVILSAGGDGTLNQVLNGILLATSNNLPALGLLPLGSANDFARAIGASLSSESLIEKLKTGSFKTIDAGRVTCCDRNGATISRYFINACSIGMGPLVVERLERNRKKLGASLSYLISIITTFLTHHPQQLNCKSDQWDWQGKARVAAFANGIAFGNGIYIAPDAEQDDGCLKSFIAEDVPLVRFLIYLQTIKAKKKIENDRIKYGRLTKIELTAPEVTPLEAEGEIIGYLPAKIEICPKAIRFIAI